MDFIKKAVAGDLSFGTFPSSASELNKVLSGGELSLLSCVLSSLMDAIHLMFQSIDSDS